MNKKILFWIMIMVLLAVAVNAADYYIEQNQATDLKIICFDENNTLCDNTTTCQLSILYPDQSILLNNVSMSQNINFFNYSLNSTQTSILGEYHSFVVCQITGGDDFSHFHYEVTVDGNPLTTDTSAGIALVIFILFATSLFFLLPFVKKPLTKNMFTDLIFRRGCWAIGIYLMSLNSAIVATIAAESWLPLTREFLMGYMWIFTWGGYLLLFFTLLMTIFDLVQLKNMRRSKERYGEE